MRRNPEEKTEKNDNEIICPKDKVAIQTGVIIIAAILYFKAVFNKNYYKKFHCELQEIFNRYKNEFHTVSFDDILKIMGIDLLELQKLT